MSSLEKEILDFIMAKDIDFTKSVYNINISIDNYQFTLDAELEELEDGFLQLYLKCTLLKDYWKMIDLSDDFKEQLADYFDMRITYIEEYLKYQVGLNGCLRDNEIIFRS